MIGLVIIAHDFLASEMKKTMEHIVGIQEYVETVEIQVDDDISEKRLEIQNKIDLVNHGSGVIVLTDMFGGTPSNLAISFMENPNIEVIAGVNIPMLIKLAQIRKNQSLSEVVTEAQEAGKKYINVASKLLRKE
ncbi:MAG: PTS sugar transporter subunit IIA [Alphaproteobacteria bacterium]|nr:PTS sugar transporter subunit IIA [Alphaproteobacteria bacterium]